MRVRVTRARRVGGCAAGLVLLAVAACTERQHQADSVASAGDSGSGRAGGSVTTPAVGRGVGLAFDPASIKVGDTLGGLRAAHVDIARAAGDMGYVGDVRFEGEVTISGDRMTHPDYPEVKEVCMSVDSTSASRLPRFPGDQRRRWLCFEDRDAAARQLGEAGSRGGMTVVIDRFQTVRHFSDVYDTAKLIRVVEDRRER